MTVWVFGDSFSLTTDNPHPDQWMHRLATDLNTIAKSYGLHGSSLEFTFYRFNLVRNDIKENDVVIINLTRSNRRWFFPDFPTIHGLEAPNNNDNQLEAVRLYETLLNKNNDPSFVHLLNFLYNLHNITKKLNLKTIVMSNANEEHNLMIESQKHFPLFSIVKGMLRDLSINEYKKEHQYLLTQTKNIGAFDPRMNHLIRSNHLILAHKMLQNILHNTPIDISQNIMKNVIYKELLEDDKFIEYELFNNWTQTLYHLDLNNPKEINGLFK